MIDFYIKYFNGKASDIYNNPQKRFTSCFIFFDGDCRLELMNRTDIANRADDKDCIGITHLAFSVGSKEKVNQLTEHIRVDGFTVVSNPRITGDGYYESVVLDPDGNFIEITI